MSDLFDDPAPGDNAPEFTVSELSGAVKRVVEGEFAHVRVRGEVGRVSRPRSGHVYLDLKDDRAVLACVVWRHAAQRLRHPPEEGMEVIASGRLSTFPGQSRYQLIIEHLAPAGAGALMAMLEERKRKLEKEGLFAAARKKPLPFLPETIGVITSPSGAVIRDILHRLGERFPRRVLLWPVAVQGERCAAEVATAIRGFDALPPGGSIPRPDVLIVARGGGSIEDLWGFNEEIVVRAAADCSIPLISAVGHETDTTLIDHAADRRAPTPTAAAELAVPVLLDLRARLQERGEALTRCSARGLEDRRRRLRDLSRGLPRPETLLAERSQRLDAAAERLPLALRRFLSEKRVALGRAGGERLRPELRNQVARRRERLADRASRLAPALTRLQARREADLRDLAARIRPERLEARRRRLAAEAGRLGAAFTRAAAQDLARRRERLAAAARLVEGVRRQDPLKRGYALVRRAGAPVTSAAALAPGDAVDIAFADGAAPAVIGAADAPPAKPRPARKAAKPREEDPQGSLF